MTPRTPQVGDTITTAEELDALPGGAVVLDAREDAFKLGTITNRYVSRFLPLTVLYLPGHPPHPKAGVVADVQSERAGHAARGYDAAHDAEHGLDHLCRWAEHYATLGTYEGVVKAAALLLASADLRGETPPRPEREVKAEALREVASVLSPDEVVGPGWLEDRADRIERGDA